MSIVIYGIKTCDSCRKATRALPGAAFRDIRADPLSTAERAEFIAAFGEGLLNRASTTWRGLDEAARAGSVESLLSDHPTLMKRPVIRSGAALYLGWKTDVQQSLGVA